MYNTGEKILVRDNIWFFRPGSTPNNTGIGSESCTYENPCNSDQFNQNNLIFINNVAPFANLYLADKGNYVVGPLTLSAGQSIYGRTADFFKAAPGSPVIIGNLILLGNNNLQAFQLMNPTIPTDSSATTTAIVANFADNIIIDHVKIGPDLVQPSLSVPNGSFQNGIRLNTSNAVIRNSTINAGNTVAHTGYTFAGGTRATGVYAYQNSNLTLENSTINVRIEGDSNVESGQSSALYSTGILVNNSNSKIYNNTINVTATGKLLNSGLMAVTSEGLYVYQNRPGKILT